MSKIITMRLLVFFFIIYICERGSGTIYQCNPSASCGCSTTSTLLTRIVGGETAVQGSWSWAVSLRYYSSHFCGGSVLSPLFIITAGHCIQDITNLASITVVAGSATLDTSSSNKLYQTRSIVQIYKHPNYDSNTQSNDLALLRLSSPLNMTNGNIKPICLPTGTTPQPLDNIDMIAVGWGVTSMSSNTVSSTLQQVTIQSIPKTSKDCFSILFNSQLQFCAGVPTGGKDTCQGDSGGPLMTFVNGLWQLHGLTSYGIGCALPGYPGVYTRVSYYINWIKSITQLYEITTTTTTKKTTTTTTNKQTSSKKSVLNTVRELVLNVTNDPTISTNLLTILPQTSNTAKFSTIQSLFLIFCLPVIISTYSFLLLFTF